tara:strand:+ start:804 stop:3503 length:2700 start_codon:yes stop_codon:yes gene_type:complete
MDFSDVKPTEKKLKNNIMSSINSTVNTKPIIEKQDNTSSSNSMFAGMAAKQSSNSMLKQDQSNQQSAISNNVDDTDVKTVATDTDNQEKNNNKNVETKENNATGSSRVEPEKNVLYQDDGFVDDHESVTFNFEETDLSNVASYMEKIHNIKFVPEDIISAEGQAKDAKAKDIKGLAGHKISFRTNKILTKKESWDLFITFLHIAGLDVVPMAQEGFYKIVAFSKANSEAIPSYIGLNPDILPDNEMVVRYVYFLKNIDPTKIQPILLKMQSGSAKLDVFNELKALIFTDRSSNIKSLMQIVQELDKSILPETLSVLKLKRTNVEDVITLYRSLKPTGSGTNQPQRAWVPGKKDPSLEYFPQDVSMFADKRTNSLILLGSDKAIRKIEDFIEQHVDVDIDRDSPPLFTYQLQYTNASDIQQLLNKVVQYGSGTSGGQAGSVRDGVQYFSKMTIVPESQSNSLIINATKEDYEALIPLIKELDIPQKQIGLEVLIVQINDSEAKVLGSQISGPRGPNSGSADNRSSQTFAQNISAQTSGILNTAGSSTSIITTNPGANEEYSIKSSLARLLGSSVVNEAGSILVTFGKPIWALFKVLKSMVSTHVVSNPFVVVSNNSQAKVAIGEQRRVISGQTIAQNGTVNSFTDQPSTLGFTITPQINKNNIVNLTISVKNDQFSVAGSETSAAMDKKQIDTYASVASGEVLVLGGIMQESYSSTHRGVPLLEHIPIFGWLFKSKTKSIVKNHFLIFISPRLLDPVDKKGLDRYTQYKMEEAEKNIEMMDELNWFASKRDPIQKAFFGESSKNLRKLKGYAQETETFKKRKERNAKRHQKQKAIKEQYHSDTKIKKHKKDKKNRLSKKMSKNATEAKTISFENDFNVSHSGSLYAKNAISNSLQQQGGA